MQNLADRVAWITGAASGIGLALAHQLADEKMKLVLVDIEEGPLREAENALRDKGAEVLAQRADVSNARDMASAAQRALDTFGLVHLIVNNAGVGGAGGPMWLLSEDDWRWTLDVNLWGVLHGIRLLLAPLVASGEEGHIVNTASIAGLTSTPFMGPYTATKHAVVALSECLAKELELAKAKVGVSVLCPGFVKTKIASSQRNRPGGPLGPGGRAPGSTEAKFGQVLDQLVAAGQPPEKIAEAVVRAVKDSRFYILTHPKMKPQIEHRMRQILDEQAPGIDPLFRQLFGG
ncbi:MAG: SDR family NAD(P)-dependent oxidoreductase [Kofleriaceae bacterium]|nr:SDR family NAD(P)-dependent oxidoreductase [Kofleriaceae bacterium]